VRSSTGIEADAISTGPPPSRSESGGPELVVADERPTELGAMPRSLFVDAFVRASRPGGQPQLAQREMVTPPSEGTTTRRAGVARSQLGGGAPTNARFVSRLVGRNRTGCHASARWRELAVGVGNGDRVRMLTREVRPARSRARTARTRPARVTILKSGEGLGTVLGMAFVLSHRAKPGATVLRCGIPLQQWECV
jgi:hypothetical protein